MASEAPRDGKDILLDLDFTPEWARSAPGVRPHFSGDRHEAREERRDTRGRRPARPRRHDPRGREPGRRSHDREYKTRTPDHRARPPRRRDTEMHPPPYQVSFLPDRKGLGVLVKKLHDSLRAYPLYDIACLLLNQPDHLLIKLEKYEDAGDQGCDLFQCGLCKAVFLDRAEAVQHCQKHHMSEYFDVEESESEPPGGNFVCVGRCRLSGTLVGPPNYHGFKEAIHQLHLERYAHMTQEQYRAQIEMVHDEALITEWKEQARKQFIYRPKVAEEAPEMTQTEAVKYFEEHFADKAFRHQHRAILPNGVAVEQSSPPIRGLIRSALQREKQRPFTMMMALRPAFRHMGLHVFRAEHGSMFVSRVKPRSIDPSHAVETIREIIDHLEAQPGSSAEELLEALRPGVEKDNESSRELLQSLRWLVEKGHVIAFHNGKMNTPSRWAKNQKSKTKHKQKSNNPGLADSQAV